MNKCPLLLQYFILDHHGGTQKEIDPSAYEWFGAWECHENSEYKKWCLMFPDGTFNFIRNSKWMIQSYYRYEYCAVGDPNPIAVYFIKTEAFVTDIKNIQKYRLPEKYEIEKHCCLTDRKYFISNIMPILQEYERYRDNWQTQVFVEEKKQRMQ